MTEQLGFRDKVSREAATEAERVLKDLERLRFEAHQIIHVLSALQLDVPQALRELSPFERVPVSPSETVEQIQKEKTGRKFSDKALANVRAKKQAAVDKRTEKARIALVEILSKGPVNASEAKRLMKARGFGSNLTNNAIETLGDRFSRKRESKYQGGTLWFLTNRPVTLEALRDEVVKQEGIVPLEELQNKLGFGSIGALRVMLHELVRMNVLTESPIGDFAYARPKVTPVKTERDKKNNGSNFGGSGVATGSKRMSSDKDVQAVVNRIVRQGAKTTKAGSGHITVEYNGQTTTINSTPGRSGLAQDKQNLKRMGLNV